MKRKLGINTDCLRDALDEVSTLKLAREIGFEAITTTTTEKGAVSALKKAADALCVDFPYLHAPYANINQMWLEGEGYRAVYDGMKQAIDSASAAGVSAVVVHVSSGWYPPFVNDLGLSRYDALVEYASARGVTLAFENLRVVGNIACLLDRYAKRENVRFCYDSGHEHCYTKTVSWIDIFTNKIVATHIHDNIGRPFDDKTVNNDTHWLPFDGSIDYQSMMRRLESYGYQGPLMLEVFRAAREDYASLAPKEFLATAYERIRRISELRHN